MRLRRVIMKLLNGAALIGMLGGAGTTGGVQDVQAVRPNGQSERDYQFLISQELPPDDINNQPIHITPLNGRFSPIVASGNTGDIIQSDNLKLDMMLRPAHGTHQNGSIWSNQPIFDLDKDEFSTDLYVHYDQDNNPADGMTISFSSQRPNAIGFGGQSLGVWINDENKYSNNAFDLGGALRNAFSIVMDTNPNIGNYPWSLFPDRTDDPRALDKQTQEQFTKSKQYFAFAYPGFKETYRADRYHTSLAVFKRRIPVLNLKGFDKLESNAGGTFGDIIPSPALNENVYQGYAVPVGSFNNVETFADAKWHPIKIGWQKAANGDGGTLTFNFNRIDRVVKVQWTQKDIDHIFYGDGTLARGKTVLAGHKLYMGFTGTSGKKAMTNDVIFSRIPNLLNVESRVTLNTEPITATGAVNVPNIEATTVLKAGDLVHYNYNLHYLGHSSDAFPRDPESGESNGQLLRFTLPKSNDLDIDVGQQITVYQTVDGGNPVPSTHRLSYNDATDEYVIADLPAFTQRGKDARLTFAIPATVSDYAAEKAGERVSAPAGKVIGPNTIKADQFDFERLDDQNQLRKTVDFTLDRMPFLMIDTSGLATGLTVYRAINALGRNGQAYSSASAVGAVNNWYELVPPEGETINPIRSADLGLNQYPVTLRIPPWRLAKRSYNIKQASELAFYNGADQLLWTASLSGASSDDAAATNQVSFKDANGQPLSQLTLGLVRQMAKVRLRLTAVPDIYATTVETGNYLSTWHWEVQGAHRAFDSHLTLH